MKGCCWGTAATAMLPPLLPRHCAMACSAMLAPVDERLLVPLPLTLPPLSACPPICNLPAGTDASGATWRSRTAFARVFAPRPEGQRLCSAALSLHRRCQRPAVRVQT